MTQPPEQFPEYTQREPGGWQPPSGPPPQQPPSYAGSPHQQQYADWPQQPYAPWPSPYGYPPVVQQPKNGLATVAFVLGLVSLVVFPLAPVAIGVGVVALVGIRRRRESGTGFAVAGLAVGSVMTVVWAAFFAIGFAGGWDDPEAWGEPGEIHVADLAVGACFDDSDPQNGWVLERDCGRAHDGEVMATLVLPPRDWPGERAVQDDALASCDREFASYVGVSVRQTSLDPMFFYPRQSSWEHGDREVICVTYGPDGDPLTGTVRGSKR